MSESEHKMIEILRILNDYGETIGSKTIADELKNRGYILGERAVRYHMKILDEKGFTERVGYSGRKITNLGKKELEKGLVYDQVDFIFSKFEEMIYQTNFDFENSTGNVIVNTSKLALEEGSFDLIKNVFKSGLAVSSLVDIEKGDNDTEMVTIKTICGTTIDGMLLNEGIPSFPLYGGLLEIKNYYPLQFTELISYKKTSITPLEAFISEKMTSVLEVSKTGNGIIPANFRVIPSESKHRAIDTLKKLNKIGIRGVIKIGNTGEDLLGVPVEEGMVGIAIIGGIAPFCAAQESGCNVDIKLVEEIAPFENLVKIIPSNNIIKKTQKSHTQKVQFLLSKAWNLIQKVNFDIETQQGKLITNISYLKKNKLDESIEIMNETYKSSPQHISPYYKIIKKPNSDDVGIATICSLSIDGILINNGIMSTPKYGGLLEMRSKPLFIELISYSGSSIDPHEIFIFKNMTSIKSNSSGYKILLASVKEIPYIARESTEKILSKIEYVGLPVYKIGKPREVVYNAKIDNYSFGIISGSGLNPIAAIKEEGIDIKAKSIESMIDFSKMEKL
jgi:repressor of nif and glnA expression